MGVDCRIILPPNVRLDDVAKVLAILDGVPAVKTLLGRDGYYAEVAVKTNGFSDSSACAEIIWTGASGSRRLLYHFEYDGGWRLLMPRATAWNIAAGRRLIQFFGGLLDYNDCDSKDWDERVPRKSDKSNAPNDGEPWHKLQDRLLRLKPLSDEEIKAADKVAAYKLEDQP